MWRLIASKSGYLFLAFLLAGCNTGVGSNASSSESLATAPAVGIVVTQDDPTLPAGCSPRQVARLMMRFLDAFNRGDQAQLATFFGADFLWYSVTDFSLNQDEYHHFPAYSRDDLMPYFARRHAQHERLRLLTVSVGRGEDPTGRSFVNINYQLTRTADDIGPGWGGPEHLAGGKGAIHCQEQTIFVWSMGQNMAHAGESLPVYVVCPTPTSPTLTTTVIACAMDPPVW